ncbi:purine-cytosine permease family protein [Paenarthrobacter nicotinovorans]|uniref:purine-cytosine permease family protein n=1 Tax=Paenarthrobacter nicotinovorans TaxID=29320 RepID=UPI003DA1E039
MKDSSTAEFEAHHVDPVPASERGGRARDLFHVWFSANLNLGNAIYGYLIVLICPNFWLAVLAIITGNMIGTVLMALHSVQGARLGIPQLIQSRGQFGFYGALVPVLAALLMYGGFTISVTIVGGQALQAATDNHVGLKTSMIIIAVLSLVIAIVGYKAIHKVAKWAALPLTISILVIAIAAIVSGGPLTAADESVSAASFLTAVGIATSFALTYAPFVSDYSRYLPEKTSGPSIFWWTAGGVFLSATSVCLLGALLTVRFPAADLYQGAGDAMGRGTVSTIVLLITALGLVLTNVLNVYGGMLNLITGLSSFVRIKTSVRTRTVMLLPTFAIGTVLALFASESYAANLAAFISVLLLLLIPWGAVNLVDFYLVQHGSYNLDAMYVKSGPYWHNPATWTWHGFNFKVLIAYTVGVLAGIPFASNSWFVGPLAEQFGGGGDLSWIPGLIVTSIVYIALVRLNRKPTPAPAEETSEPTTAV